MRISALIDHVDEDKTIIQKGQIATLEIPNRGLTIIKYMLCGAELIVL